MAAAIVACVDCPRGVVAAFSSAAGCLDAVRVPLAAILAKLLDEGAPGVGLGSTVWESNHSGFRAPDCYFVRSDHLPLNYLAAKNLQSPVSSIGSRDPSPLYHRFSPHPSFSFSELFGPELAVVWPKLLPVSHPLFATVPLSSFPPFAVVFITVLSILMRPSN